jgi:hypothetical protein
MSFLLVLTVVGIFYLHAGLLVLGFFLLSGCHFACFFLCWSVSWPNNYNQQIAIISLERHFAAWVVRNNSSQGHRPCPALPSQPASQPASQPIVLKTLSISSYDVLIFNMLLEEDRFPKQTGQLKSKV